jgi:hypothetical protein
MYVLQFHTLTTHIYIHIHIYYVLMNRPWQISWWTNEALVLPSTTVADATTFVVLGQTQQRHLANFKEQGNPFTVNLSTPSNNDQPNATFSPIAIDNVAIGEIYNLLESFCGSHNPDVSGVVPKCFSDGVLKWVARLLMIMHKLPPLAEDACKLFFNIFDLYTTTAFQVCSGSSNHEHILLGLEAPKTNITMEQPSRAQGAPSPLFGLPSRAQGASSPLFGFRRRSTSSQKLTRTTPTMSPAVFW